MTHLRWENRPRRGVVLVAVLVSLAVAGAILLSLAKAAAMRKGVLEASSRRLQAELLCQSGLERAAARLAADAEYGGETWSISASDAAHFRKALVAIKVEKIPDKPDCRQVRVCADYPDDPIDRARSESRVVVKLNP